MYKVKISQFEGPLDLLLQLIQEQKLDITQVSLAQVTDQYINYLYQDNQILKRSPGELADFLVVAAKLLLIKSKALLPYLSWGEEDEGIELERQLKIYREYFEASKVLQKIISRKKFNFAREKLLIKEEIGFQPPKSLTVQKLVRVFLGILKEIEPLTRIPKEVITKTINIQEKIKQIRDLIFKKVTMHFGDLLKQTKSKTEIIVSFLALLELIKQKEIIVSQNGIFQEMEIKRITDDQ